MSSLSHAKKIEIVNPLNRDIEVRLLRGEKAPHDGVLLSDKDFRYFINLEVETESNMDELDLLSERYANCSDEIVMCEPDPKPHPLYFFLGGLLLGVALEKM